ncbi:hypothetical protein QL285_020733 [Trifolium repens]|nr:hypothetical protein QL285_020733 [Trifolium repens]
MKEANGHSGGLLSVWNKDLFSFSFSFSGTGYLGVCVEWKSTLLYIVNIYSPCSLAGKRQLWNDLLHFKTNNLQGEWCVGGDFNSISKVGERKGRSNGGGNQSERVELSQFIDAMELIDIPISGKKFSWFSSYGSSMSRLDRFLLSEGFIEKGGITNQWIAARDISDHCPIWLVSNNLDWGPKPFKFNNCWLDHPAFIPFVTEFWEKTVIKGKKAFILKEKLKKLKESLKVWNREVFGLMDLNINKTVKELNEVEDALAEGLGDPTQNLSSDLTRQFWEQIHRKESLLHQKSRSKWIQEGDSNSRFFHASIKGRRRKNTIAMLQKGEGWIKGVDSIKHEVKDHFSKHFAEEWTNRPFLQGIDFPMLTTDDNTLLLAPFEEEEVRDIIWSCDGVSLYFRQAIMNWREMMKSHLMYVIAF